MTAVQIATPFNLSLDFEIAPLHKRIFAYAIDLFIIIAYAWIIGNFINTNSISAYAGGDKVSTAWSIVIISLPVLLYPLVCEVALHGQTVGKKVLDIRVMNLDGGEPTLSQYVIRWIFRFFEWPVVFGVVFPGFLILYQVFMMVFPGIVVISIIAITRRHQRLGDLAANTVLVKTRIDTSINDTVFQEVDYNNYQVMFPQVMQLSDRDINIIKSVITSNYNKNTQQLAERTAVRVKTALKIETDTDAFIFLEKLLQDYNYLATRE